MKLSVDPSVNNLGVALYDPDAQNFEWALIMPTGSFLTDRINSIHTELSRWLRYRNTSFDGIYELVCEFPMFFNSEKGAVAATMGFTHPLAAICGYLAGVCKFAKVRFYTPIQWKGNLTKAAIQFRFEQLFPNTLLPSEHEQEAVVMLHRHNEGTISNHT